MLNDWPYHPMGIYQLITQLITPCKFTNGLNNFYRETLHINNKFHNNANLHILESVHSSFQKPAKLLSLAHLDNNQNCMRRKLQCQQSILHSLQTYCKLPNHMPGLKDHKLLEKNVIIIENLFHYQTLR